MLHLLINIDNIEYSFILTKRAGRVNENTITNA